MELKWEPIGEFSATMVNEGIESVKGETKSANFGKGKCINTKNYWK